MSTTDTMTMLAFRLAEIGDHEGMAGVIARMTDAEAAQALNTAALLVDSLGQAISPDEGERLTECMDCGALSRDPDGEGWTFIADGYSQYCMDCTPDTTGEEAF